MSEIRNLPGHVFLPGALALPSCLRSIRARDFGARAPVPAPIPCRHGPSPSIPGGDLRGTPDRGPPRPGFVLRSRRAAERRRQTVAAAVPGADAVVVPLFALGVAAVAEEVAISRSVLETARRARHTTASASISTRIAGSMSPATTTSVVAGAASRKNSPWARPTSRQYDASVT